MFAIFQLQYFSSFMREFSHCYDAIKINLVNKFNNL